MLEAHATKSAMRHGPRRGVRGGGSGRRGGGGRGCKPHDARHDHPQLLLHNGVRCTLQPAQDVYCGGQIEATSPIANQSHQHIAASTSRHKPDRKHSHGQRLDPRQHRRLGMRVAMTLWTTMSKIHQMCICEFQCLIYLLLNGVCDLQTQCLCARARGKVIFVVL
jgi:hypothetical protein